MEKQLSIAIRKIKELEFSIDSTAKAPEEPTIGFGVITTTDIEKEIFEIQVTYDLKNPESDSILVHIKVSTVFNLLDIKQFLNEDNKSLNLPNNGLITMLSLSISHTRAILAKNTFGTDYETYYLPIVNPTEIANEVFKLNLNV